MPKISLVFPVLFSVSLVHAATALPVSSTGEPAAAEANEPAPLALDQVDVTADKAKNFSLPLDATAATSTRLGLSVRDTPASVSIITQEMMQTRGFRTAVEAVEGAVGMTGGTQFGSIPGYSTRGFGGNSLTVLRDGVRQNTASQSARTVDSFLLDRVEVLKGPASLMAGEGAVGGAVNYVSKAPDRVARGELLTSWGAWNSDRVGLGLGGPIALGNPHAPLRYRFDVSLNSTDGYQDRNHQDYYGFGGALSWQLNDKFSVTYSGTWLKDSVESYYGNPVLYDAVVDTTIPGALPEVRRFVAATDRLINARVDPAARRTNYDILDNYADTENSFNRVRAELAVSPDLDLRNEVYATTQLLKWRNLESNLWNPVTHLVDRSSFLTIYRDDVLLGDRLDATAKQSLRGLPNRLVLGSSLERNDQIRGGTPGNVPTTLSSVTLLNPDVGNGPPARFQKTSRIVVSTHAFFAEDVLEVFPSLKLVGGLRYDHITVQRDTLPNPTVTPNATFTTFQKGYRPLTGRAGVVWSLGRRVNAYAAFSTAADPVNQLVSLNVTQADFSLQKGRQFEVGLKGSLLNDRLDVTLALFDIKKKDLLSSTLDPITGVRISQQIGAQTSRGVESAVALSLAEGWRLELNGAYTDASFADFNENLGTGVISRAGKRPPNVPEWVANFFLSKRFANGFFVSGGPRYVGDRYGNNSNSVIAKAYTTLDLSVGYTWKAWTTTLRGRNLLNEDYEPVAGTTMRRLADPRNAEVSVAYTF